MPKIYILLVFSLATLIGCASTLPITSTQKNLIAHMTPAKADHILKTAMLKTNAQAGLFANRENLVPNLQILKVENGKVEYRNFKKHLTNDMKKALIEFGLEDDHDYRTINFRKLKTIRIINATSLRKGIITSVNGVQFGIFFKNGEYINIDTTKSNADKIISASLFFSPKAELLK